MSASYGSGSRVLNEDSSYKVDVTKIERTGRQQTDSWFWYMSKEKRMRMRRRSDKME